LLQPCKIPELTFDTDSYEVGVSSDISSVDGDIENVPRFSKPQPYHQKASRHESSSSILSSASDEEDADVSRPGEQIHQAVTLQWLPINLTSRPYFRVSWTYILLYPGSRGRR
jgi:hypothetical protein